jgi:cytochrome c553
MIFVRLYAEVDFDGASMKIWESHRPRPTAARPAGLFGRARGVATLAALALCAATVPARAADEPARLRTRALAATCAQCHGTEGQAVAGQALVRLAGLPQDYLLAQLMAFRNGQRSATIMHQITRGYSQEQLETLAAFFAAQR